MTAESRRHAATPHTVRGHDAILLAALVLCALPVTPASAQSTYTGGCGFHDGHIQATLVLHGTDNPVSAVVTCAIKDKDVVVRTATFAGTGVVAGVDLGEYVPETTEYLHFCETVDFTSDDTPTVAYCVQPDPTQIPPQEVVELLEDVTTRS